MNESQNSDDELLALLQPAVAAEEFSFDSAPPAPIVVDTSSDDGDHNASLPGPPPPAGLPGLSTEAIEPEGSLAEDSSERTGLKSSQEIHDSSKIDEDEIAYEPKKTPSRTPRSAKTRSSAAGALSQSITTRTPSKAKAKTQTLEMMGFKKAQAVPDPSAQSQSPPTNPQIPRCDFEIVIEPVSAEKAREYKAVAPGDEIYRVLERIPTGVPGETWLSVEFEDGRIDQVS